MFVYCPINIQIRLSESSLRLMCCSRVVKESQYKAGCYITNDEDQLLLSSRLETGTLKRLFCG